MLTDKEKLIIKEIEENPLIKQEELAIKLAISRIAVAAHISNLQKKGFIVGRGYFLKYPSTVSVVGGINLAFIGISIEKFEGSKNNLGRFETSIKGTAYNIFNTLSKWDNEVNYISFTGDDFYGDEITNLLKKNKVENIELFRIKGLRTGIYTSLESSNSEFIGAILSMELFDNLSLNEFKNIIPKIQNSSILYIDTNYPIQIVNEVANLNSNNYVIYNTITSLKTYRENEMKFRYDFLCTSVNEVNKMFDQEHKTEEETYNFLKKQGIENGMIYSKEKTIIFDNEIKFNLKTEFLREYYISKVIYLKKANKILSKEKF